MCFATNLISTYKMETHSLSLDTINLIVLENIIMNFSGGNNLPASELNIDKLNNCFYFLDIQKYHR